MTTLVVAGVIVRHGLVLAARRTGRPAGWEFPGGKVEPGETQAGALSRELREELGVDVRVGDAVGRAGDGRVSLVLFACTLVDGEPVPRADHDTLSWLDADGLDALDWLPLDRELLPAARALLGG